MCGEVVLAEWDGVLVTSTSRLALPVDFLELPGGEVRRFDPAHPLVQRLRNLTTAAVCDHCEPLV